MPDALRSYYGVHPTVGNPLAPPADLTPPGRPYFQFPGGRPPGPSSYPPDFTVDPVYINRETYRGDRKVPPRRRLLEASEGADAPQPRARVLEAARGSAGTGEEEPLSPQEQALHKAWREKEGAALRGGGA